MTEAAKTTEAPKVPHGRKYIANTRIDAGIKKYEVGDDITMEEGSPETIRMLRDGDIVEPDSPLVKVSAEDKAAREKEDKAAIAAKHDSLMTAAKSGELPQPNNLPKGTTAELGYRMPGERPLANAPKGAAAAEKTLGPDTAQSPAYGSKDAGKPAATGATPLERAAHKFGDKSSSGPAAAVGKSPKGKGKSAR